MVRNLFGILLALIGAAAAAWSAFLAWYGDRLGRYFRLEDLFSTGITDVQAGLFTGLFLPMLVAAVLALLGVLVRSRFVVLVSGLIVLGFTALWLVRQGQEAAGLTFGGNGIAEGVGVAAGGGLLLLIAAIVMRGRRPSGTRRRGAHARVDGGGSSAPYDGREPSESPQPYGPFGDEADEPRGAYQADEGSSPPPGRYEDDATPAQEWDPWARPPRSGQQSPPQGPQQQPPGPPQGPSGTQRIPRRPDHRRDGRS